MAMQGAAEMQGQVATDYYSILDLICWAGTRN